MTGVPRLQHLPVPAVSAGAPAVAAPPGAGGRRVEAVVPVTAAERHQAETEHKAAWARDAGRDAPGERAGGGGRGAAAGALDGAAARGRLSGFSRLTSLPFAVQLLGQQSGAGRSQAALPQTALSGHRDAALMGSDFYRRSGGEPEILPAGATFVRLAV